MNVELANYLIGLDKYIVESGELIENKNIQIESRVRLKFNLVAKEDPEQVFLVDIKESDKRALKISIHHQDDSTQFGLLRVDYYSRHKNPVEITDTVPEHFKPFAGIFLDEYPGHIHYIVDGYTPLAWAIPLEFDDFQIKDIRNVNDIASAIIEFLNKINLKTEMHFTAQMRIL